MAFGHAQGPGSPCNGDSELCDRRYDQVAYATTHNAHSSWEAGFFLPLPNQEFDIRRQLDDGVRALMIDTYEWFGDSYLCHGSCWGGATLLTDGLGQVKQFLDTSPNEVVTIIIESYLSEADTRDAFVATGLDAYLHVHTDGQPWLTLGELIQRGERLVVFTDDASATLPWHHYLWQFAWETPFSFASLDEFVCTENRGTPPDDLFILNHFVTGPLGAVEDQAPTINDYFELFNRAGECWGYEPTNPTAHLPNFVTVDHYDEGHVFEAIAALNESWPYFPLLLENGPLVAGQPGTFLVTKAVPQELVFFVYSLSGRGFGPCFDIGEGLCLELLDPDLVSFSWTVAEPSGIAQITPLLPLALSGLDLAAQAVAVRETGPLLFTKSQAISATVQ